MFVKRLCFITKVPSLPGSSGSLISPPSPTPRSYKFFNPGHGTNCNELRGELMPAEAGCIPTRPASVDQVYTQNNTHSGDGIS